MIRRTILEWEIIRHGEDAAAIPEAAAANLAAVAAASPLSGRNGDAVLYHRRDGLSANGVVGIVAADGATLEILPKIDVPGSDPSARTGAIRRRLVHMLAVAMDVRIEAGMLSTLDWQRESMLEILIRLFVEKLTDALRQGMPRRYVDQAEDRPAMRGSLDMIRQFTVLAAAPQKLACRFDDLSEDIALNRIMKAAVTRLARLARTSANQRRLRELTFAYADIADVPRKQLRWEDVVLDRTNARWRELVDLARLLIGDRFQTTSGGAGSGYSLLFEMSTLFEEYVTRMLSRALSGTGRRVVAQGGRLYCLESEDNGRALFQTRPDILIKRGDVVEQVIDTKWKRIAGRIDDPKQGVSQADVYQMMAYGQLYRAPRLTLLFPHHAGLHCSEGVMSSHKVNETSARLEIATIDIGITEAMAPRLAALCLAVPVSENAGTAP